jgi:tetratricopeptide (TPR) repeat protein
VYLHYNQSDRRELVINRGSAEVWHNLPYQTFVQYLRAFVPFPPSWIREGFAIYFSTIGFSGAGEINYEENLSWLETVKGLGDKAPGIEDILLADERGIPENFQSISWSLVSFFLSSGREEYFRTLTDCFMALSAEKNAAENSAAIANRIQIWNSIANLERDYRAYINSRKTFAELLAEGEKAYTGHDPATAELAFVTAMNQKPSHHAPFYYLGLLSYEENNYAMAEEYYRMSLERGADRALISYARGVNAASAGKNREAIAFLEEAAAASPARYKEKAEGLIGRLK